ncbi:ABC transporter ATP-binding protein [Paenibacillus senegalensis]|uniref:ABC transporter ATP-binding protein n=1 Tax=Paenibacillus senegalensis TaxID=1465766 RepID=UPI0002887E4E|nr:ATP-binding cassette domain-containing protein [Paenibacillus senegalensis]
MHPSPLLEIRQVAKTFTRRNTGRGKRHKSLIHAVRDVSLELYEQEIFALIGESGSGKSTLAEFIVRLQRPDEGEIIYSPHISWQQIQMVFQNPDRSMNPYWTIADIVTEPLRLSGVHRQEALDQAAELMKQVHLPVELLERKTAECSGGQKQRIAIARALTMNPRLLIADEITSALDPSTEQELLRLLQSLKQERQMALLYITHRLETINGFADRIAVMKDGVIVENGTASSVLQSPESEYTRQLLAACSY